MMSTWTVELKKSFTKIEDITEIVYEKNLEVLKEVTNRFPMMIPEYYYKLIDPNDPNDPIKLLSVPQLMETDESGQMDTSGESQNTKFEGVQHKYSQTMLVLTTNVCYMYCRHCFRKRLVGYTSDEVSKRMDQTLDYLKAHHEINNILLTGGDFFTLSNAQIEEYLENLSQVEHLDFIRFGTRVPVVYPMRISDDQEFLDILEKYNEKKQLSVVTQFNHPKEITAESTLGVKELLKRGIPVNNQTVLLKGINDDPEVLAELMKKLTKIGIAPYYVFQCRPVSRVKNQFQLSLSESYDIVEEAKSKMNGHGKRFKFAMSHPRGKIEIIGKLDNQLIFKFHQAKYQKDQSFVFMREIVEGAGWLDEDLNFIV